MGRSHNKTKKRALQLADNASDDEKEHPSKKQNKFSPHYASGSRGAHTAGSIPHLNDNGSAAVVDDDGMY